MLLTHNSELELSLGCLAKQALTASPLHFERPQWLEHGLRPCSSENFRTRSYFCLWFSYRSVSYRTFSLSCTHIYIRVVSNFFFLLIFFLAYSHFRNRSKGPGDLNSVHVSRIMRNEAWKDLLRLFHKLLDYIQGKKILINSQS